MTDEPVTLATGAPAPGGTRRAGREWVGMAAVGLASLVVDFGVFNLLLWAGASPAIANLAALVVATAAAYWGNLRWTFAHRQVANRRRALAAFFVVNLASAAVVQAGVMLTALVTLEPATLNAAKLALTVLATLARFVLYRGWVYRESGELPAAATVVL